MRFFSSFTIGLFSCLLLVGCKKEICNDPTDPDCPNYEYCTTVENLSADFTTYVFSEFNPGFGDGELYPVELVVRDTTFGGLLHFRALDESADTYEWKFPRDARTFSGQITRGQFPPDVINGEVSLKLTTLRNEVKCPDRGAEVAEHTEKIFIVPPDADFNIRPITGQFIGNNTSEPDSANFVITFFEDTEYVKGDTLVRIKNFPRNAANGERFDNPILFNNYKEFYIEPTANICCDRVHGYGQLSDDKQDLRIEYKTYDFDRQEWIEDVWTGTRLN
ncbi:hypothetical protein CLV84_0442 [Neolewinella xylanilytica]|uniref:Uncharacterized protein n=1 Tax=Neolewinella xylanilytica TaxID=1514080 RepID=A0A2S6I7S3_9BACT|nr:hypothetical protein [Neolewinella xylanilytica]PPK87499.1 hypothetical protein CLV84_0442 [Neolewinella xylanilytica]